LGGEEGPQKVKGITLDKAGEGKLADTKGKVIPEVHGKHKKSLVRKDVEKRDQETDGPRRNQILRGKRPNGDKTDPKAI